MFAGMLNGPDGQHTQHVVSQPAEAQQRCRGHAQEMHWKPVGLTLRKYTQTLSRTPKSM